MQGQAIYNDWTPREPRQKARGEIQGGIISIAPISIIIAWAAFRQSLIDWLTLRVWFALWEVKRWHEARVRAGEPYRYDVGEVLQALQTKRLTKKKVQAALNQLQALGIIRFSETTIWFASHLDHLSDSSLRLMVEEMLGPQHKNNYQKGINFPRRILKFIITTKSYNPVLIGTALGLIIRCMLVKRYGRYQGCCKSDWIEAVFGGDLTSISSARAKLIRWGWFVRLEGIAQRVKNIHGDWFALGLEIVVVEDIPETLEVAQTCSEPEPVDNSELIAPLEAPKSTEIEGPEAPKSTEIEGPIKPVSSPTENINNQITGVSRATQYPQNQAITWINIQKIDISLPERCEVLFNDAVGRGILGDNQADKLTFFAAASRAVRKATKNACGFFRSIIENPEYRGFIAQEDEDRARDWFRETLERESWKSNGQRGSVATSEAELPSLSKDAKTVRELSDTLQKAGFSGDLFRIVRRTSVGRKRLEGWTHERWEAAEEELLNYPLVVARARLKNDNMNSAGDVMDGLFSGGVFGDGDAH